jgi:hypothetical protein
MTLANPAIVAGRVKIQIISASPPTWMTTDHEERSKKLFHEVPLSGSDPARKRELGLTPW